MEIFIVYIFIYFILMKISEPNKKLLEAAGGFYYSKRESGHNKLPPDVTTYWLLGKVPTEGLLNQPIPLN